MTRDRRPGVLRRWFDERAFGYNWTPFGIDQMLVVGPLLGALGWAIGWLAATVAGSQQPGEIGAMVGGGILVTYWLAVTLGTLAFRLHDWRARAARMRDTRGPFEKTWSDLTAAAFRALGQARPQELPAERKGGIGGDLWNLVDDRPRAVIMEAFARLERRFSGLAQPPPTPAARAYTPLRQLRQLAVLHEFAIAPRKAREFLYLCALTDESLRGNRE